MNVCAVLFCGNADGKGDEVGTLRFNTHRVINKAIKLMRIAKDFWGSAYINSSRSDWLKTLSIIHNITDQIWIGKLSDINFRFISFLA